MWSEPLLTKLAQHAPTWLVQMPSLLDEGELESLQRRVQAASRERMLRELTEAVDAITVERPLVLVLEDLQWSDYATLDLVSWLAHRQEPARLLVVATDRPVELIVGDHPLQTVKQELLRHRQPDTRVVILTASDESSLVTRATAAGAAGFLSKNGALGDVLNALRTAHGGGMTVSTDILARLLRSTSPVVGPRGGGLTVREDEVLHLMAAGLDARAITIPTPAAPKP